MIISFIVAILAFLLVELIWGPKRNSYIKSIKKPEGNFLFVDTETNGLPLNWKLTANDLNNWPNIVEIAWIQIKPDGSEISSNNFIIKPINFTISEEVQKIHGISHEYALENGSDIKLVLNKLIEVIMDSKYLISHNIDFDSNVIGSELLRNGFTNHIESLEKICTMKKGTDFCKISSRYGYKWPTLAELHYKLFKIEMEVSHRAMNDVSVCLKCFKKMYNDKIIQL